MTITTARITAGGIPADLFPIMQAIAGAARDLSRLIARGPHAGGLGAEVGQNRGGDGQKALDVLADDKFRTALAGTGVRFYASEELDGVAEIDAEGRFALAIDPLDGSSNIDLNISIGTIFSIYPAAGSAESSFLRPVSQQIAAGYVLYGPHTAMIVSFGADVKLYVLDPETGGFILAAEGVTVAPGAKEFAINASNYRHWPRPVRAYFDDCLAGTEGPRGSNFNMRWIASLVAETHRILTRGGIFLYPADARKGYEHGRLRLLYECAPIAFLMRAAGGDATTGTENILSMSVNDLHQRVPFIFGSAEKVARIEAYHDLPAEEVSALFGNRGLFRV
jgi:fructose-1,6-bisphosphatase I